MPSVCPNSHFASSGWKLSVQKRLLKIKKKNYISEGILIDLVVSMNENNTEQNDALKQILFLAKNTFCH